MGVHLARWPPAGLVFARHTGNNYTANAAASTCKCECECSRAESQREEAPEKPESSSLANSLLCHCCLSPLAADRLALTNWMLQLPARAAEAVKSSSCLSIVWLNFIHPSIHSFIGERKRALCFDDGPQLNDQPARLHRLKLATPMKRVKRISCH